MLGVDPDFAVGITGFVDDVIAVAGEGIGGGADGGGFHQVQLAELVAFGGDVPELLGAARPGNARKVDFQEFGVGVAVGGAVQDAVDVIKHGEFIRRTMLGMGGEGLEFGVNVGVEVDAAGLVDVLLSGIEVERMKNTAATIKSIKVQDFVANKNKIPLHLSNDLSLASNN